MNETDIIDLWISIEQILTVDEFRIFEGYHRGHMTQQQIAEEVGIDQRTVGRRLEKMYKKIRTECLK